ncbi:MAG: DUF3846 domain-containing protein [Ruminococcaceae bacterium]|nr:DUF3846 domain-containing protein [Oscillospiraceae bacterium]
MKVVIKNPGEEPYFTDIENSLSELQRSVGGYIETVTIAKDMTIICNEDGRLLEMPYNCNICGVDFVGPIIFAGVDGDEFCDIPASPDEFRRIFKKLFRNLIKPDPIEGGENND